MKVIVILTLALVYTICVVKAQEDSCTTKICDSSTCAKPNCNSNQILVPKGDCCKCCDVCYDILKLDDDCQAFVDECETKKRCGEGLRCCGYTKKCVVDE